MTEQDVPAFYRRLKAFAELYDAKFSDAKSQLYFEALRDLPFEVVADAMSQAAKTCTFCPRPAQIRELAGGNVDDRIESAWMAFRKAAKLAGSYASLILDATLAEAIVATFQSWPQACLAELTPEMWASKRKEFGRVYRVIADRQLQGQRYLPGICETENGGRTDWMKFVPVHRLEGEIVRRLSLEQAEQARTQLAGLAGGMRQLADGSDLDALRIPRERATVAQEPSSPSRQG